MRGFLEELDDTEDDGGGDGEGSNGIIDNVGIEGGRMQSSSVGPAATTTDH